MTDVSMTIGGERVDAPSTFGVGPWGLAGFTEIQVQYRAKG